MHPAESSPQRIVVIGTSATGKTTMAAILARRLQMAHVELDGLHWEAHWTEAATPVFRARVAAALMGERWVVDGNYGKARDLIWPHADTAVWLDYPLPIILWRLLSRTARRIIRREQLWNGNRERLWTQIASRNSLFLWVLTTHGRRTREFLGLLARPEYAHLQVVRLRSQRQADAWLRSLSMHTTTSSSDNVQTATGPTSAAPVVRDVPAPGPR